MSDSAIAAELIDALRAAADRAVATETALVSVTVEMLARANGGSIETRVVRKTRTLIFMSAEFVSDAGARVATASSVHKLPS